MFSLLLAEAAPAALVVTPTGSRNTDGPSFAEASQVLGIETNSVRFQQVCRPIAFTGTVGPEMWIDGIVFRLDATNALASFGRTFDLQVNLSTTPHGPDDLSPIFSENLGSDDTIVLPRTNLDLSAIYWVGQSPQQFQIQSFIFFSQPFYYNTNAGNLLVDIRGFGSSFPVDPGSPDFVGPFDAVNRPNDDVSRVWAGSVNALSGTADSLGLVIGFNAITVPEPSTFMLLVCGATVLGYVVHRRKHRK